MIPRSIEIHGRRWFRKGPGNTYHSVLIVVDGETVHVAPFAYGYGSQYMWTARAWLEQASYVPGIADGESLWRYCERVGCAFLDNVSDVSRKRDLHQSLSEEEERRVQQKQQRRRHRWSAMTRPHGLCEHAGHCLEHEQDPAVKSCKDGDL